MKLINNAVGRKENNIDNLDLNLETDFNLDLDLDENKDLEIGRASCRERV